MTSYVPPYYFITEPKTIPTSTLNINDFKMHSINYQPYLKQTAQLSTNYQFNNNTPITNSMIFSSFAPPNITTTFNNQIKQTNTYFSNHFNYYQSKNLNLKNFKFEQQQKNQLIQQYSNIKNTQNLETIPIFYTNKNYNCKYNEHNKILCNFSNNNTTNYSNNFNTFFECNRDIKTMSSITNINYNNPVTSTITNQIAFNLPSVSTSSKMSLSLNKLQHTSQLSNCSNNECLIPLETKLDSLNFNTNNILNQNNISSTNKIDKATTHYKMKIAALNLAESPLNVILTPEICAKVFYPSSAINLQNHTRNLKQSRIELNQRRIHQCKEPG